jgi:hypothetical protein
MATKKEIKTEVIETTETKSQAPVTQTPSDEAPMEIPETLNQQQALQVLVDAARVSQSKGVFTLDDAELVNKAIKAFMQPKGPQASN